MSVLVDSRGNPLRAAPEAERADSWMNAQTGIGTIADKTMHGRYFPVRRVNDQELASLYNGSALAAKIACKRPIEMFRRGYDLECTDVEASACNDLKDYAVEDLQVDAVMLEAKSFANLFGGYLIVMGIDDGNMPDEPLDEARIKSFAWLNGMDRRWCYPLDYYTEPGPKCGQPRTYLTSNLLANLPKGGVRNAKLQTRSSRTLEALGGATAVIHESRCLRFDGIQADVMTRQQLAGWSWSVLQRVYDGLRKFEHSFDSANYLLSDASQGVFTLKALINAISAGGLPALMKRLDLMEQTRSVMRGIVLDENEKFERTPTPFGGVADLLDKFMLRFAADADIPVTELFGRAASGLNAAAGADAETTKWYDGIESSQGTELAPQQRRFYRLLSLSPDCPVKIPKGKGDKPQKWTIKYKKLVTPTDAEQAKTDLAIAQRDQIYLAEGVVSPEEVALDRQDMYPSMDVDAREAALKGAVAFDPYENDEPPPPPPGTVPPGAPGAPPGAPAPAGAAPPAAPAVPPAKKPAAKTAKPGLAKTKPKPGPRA